MDANIRVMMHRFSAATGIEDPPDKYQSSVLLPHECGAPSAALA